MIVSASVDASDVLDVAIRRWIASGLTFVAAAGDDNEDACTVSPPRVADAVTVAAADTTSTRATASNFGPCIDLFAPGTDTTFSAAAVAGATTSTSADTFAATPDDVMSWISGQAAEGVVRDARPGNTESDADHRASRRPRHEPDDHPIHDDAADIEPATSFVERSDDHRRDGPCSTHRTLVDRDGAVGLSGQCVRPRNRRWTLVASAHRRGLVVLAGVRGPDRWTPVSRGCIRRLGVRVCTGHGRSGLVAGLQRHEMVGMAITRVAS